MKRSTLLDQFALVKPRDHDTERKWVVQFDWVSIFEKDLLRLANDASNAVVPIIHFSS